ncbi:MAG: DUF5916 domain-containing protein [Salinibacter sp.]
MSAHPIETTLSIDGHLNENGWRQAEPIRNFRQLEPQEGSPPSQRTVVRVLYGAEAVYVGARLYDEAPDQIRTRLARRDQRNQADWFEVSIDSYYDQKTARTFAVNAAGVQRDGIIQGGSGGPGSPLDTSWDGIWRSEVRVTDDGWIAELRIPYSELRFSDADLQQWGIQFRRRIPRNSEIVEWPLVPESKRGSSLVAEYGTLTDLRNLEAGRSVQVAPYTLGRVRTQEDTDAPNTRTAASTYDIGADLEIGLGSNSTLNATINPDFGQVEADPAVLNLSAFDTFFPEKRPFFVEGTSVFDFRLDRRANLLYTRRIGADAPVVGALKLTGRSRGGLSYGLMGATTGEDFTPARGYGAGRLRQDFGTYSQAGAMLTAFEGPAQEAGRRRSVTGGLDWDLRFENNTYRARGYLSGTHRRRTQGESSPSTGWAAEAEAGRVQGNWTYDVELTLRDDDFNPNDIGRLRRNNFVQVGTFVNRQFNDGQPFGPFQRGEGFVFTGQSWSYQERLNRGVELFSRFRFLTEGFRSLTLGLEGEEIFGGYDLFETRGLWPRARPRSLSGEISLSTDTRRSWELEAQVRGTARSDGGTGWTGGVEGEWNLGSRLKLSGELSYESERGVVEWASNETFVRQSDGKWAIGTESAPPSSLDDGDLAPLEAGHERLNALLADVPPTEGSSEYYVPIYGTRDTDRLSLTLRSSVALTRNLSFEFFGQLFGARGRYQNFQILRSKDKMDSFSAYPKRHDFATSSFLSNAVLRWEFRPGSELFLVWSQDRRLNRDEPFFYDQRQSSPYDPPTSRRLTDAFEDFPRNDFIIKLRYMFY